MFCRVLEADFELNSSAKPSRVSHSDPGDFLVRFGFRVWMVLGLEFVLKTSLGTWQLNRIADLLAFQR